MRHAFDCETNWDMGDYVKCTCKTPRECSDEEGSKSLNKISELISNEAAKWRCTEDRAYPGCKEYPKSRAEALEKAVENIDDLVEVTRDIDRWFAAFVGDGAEDYESVFELRDKIQKALSPFVKNDEPNQ